MFGVVAWIVDFHGPSAAQDFGDARGKYRMEHPCRHDAISAGLARNDERELDRTTARHLRFEVGAVGTQPGCESRDDRGDLCVVDDGCRAVSR